MAPCHENTYVAHHSAQGMGIPCLQPVKFRLPRRLLAYPAFKVTPHLMLMYKAATVTVNGLNSMLAVHLVDRKVTVTVDPAFDIHKVDPPILRTLHVAAEVAALLNHPLKVLNTPTQFKEFVDTAATILGSGASFPVRVGPHCKSCPFYVDPADVTADRKSGWAECMQAHFGRPVWARRAETVFGLHQARSEAVRALLQAGQLELATLTESALGEIEDAEEGISQDQRRQLQVAEAQSEVNAPVVLTRALRSAMAQWRWPLHFIDFETSRPALPYHSGRTPYDQILFQFSHHVLTEDGHLEHRTQCLEASPGIAPSVLVLRSLRDALAGDDGTVVHWWTHEATVLKDIRRQLQKDGTSDRESLDAFIQSLVGIPGTPGRLVDLGMVVSKLAFFPGTAGSSSIKKVLPAALKYSKALRDRYGAPVYGTKEMPSHNFTEWVWVRESEGRIQDPYALLNSFMLNSVLQRAISAAEDDESGDSESFINNGGAAIIAFDQLQQQNLSPGGRGRIRTELLRYCELDTLAMVMVYQALTERSFY